MRWWHKTLLTGLALLLLLTAGAYWYLQKQLAALPVQNLQFNIDAISLHQLRLHSISFQLEQTAAQFTLSDINVVWSFSGGFSPALREIRLGAADIKLTQWPEQDSPAAATDNEPFSLPQNWQLPPTLPERISLQHVSLQLPCGDSLCHYQLNGQMTAEQQKLRFALTGFDATDMQQRLTLNGSYETVQNLPLLNVRLMLDDSINLSLHQSLIQQNNLLAEGAVELTISPPSSWLLQQAEAWQLELPADAVAQFTAPVRVVSQWSFDLPEQTDLASISQHITGHWQLDADLPAPFSVPGIGNLQGQLTAAVGFKQGELNQYQLNSKLTLQQPVVPEQLQQRGINSDTVYLDLSADGSNQPQLTALPLSVNIRTTGASQLTLSADTLMNLTPPFSASLKNGKLTWAQPHLTAATGIELEKLKLQSQFNAYWLADSWQLNLSNSEISTAKLQSTEYGASNIKLSATSSRLTGDSVFSALTFKTDMLANAGDIKQAALKAQSWQWQGKFEGTVRSGSTDNLRLKAEGKLSNHASLGLSHQLDYQASVLTLNWQLDDAFLLAGNPFQQSFTDWPALLEFNRGRITASGSVILADTITAQADIALSGVSGIYDRSLFTDLSLPLSVEYKGDTVSVSTSGATLAEIQHGVVAGPLRMQASYVTPANTPTAGKLDIRQLQLLAMGGQISVEPTLLDMALQQQQITVKVDRIDLTKLLQQHPTTDLTGNGLISGTIPLLLNRSGASVEGGYIAAESPGGQLQYRPPTAENMAATNPGMKVMLKALDDFHYSVLSSNVSYDTNGKLLLALKLHGNNPALEAGRPINLNINLEEDIPALITSLQLSSQISDKIKQRVQQRLQQQSAGKR
ncbi:YdbH domain-containing protein [Rheinheimera aquimaris]|uniref:YdbH domain-containing protein n=1 Tax=Rheinheimera aquimaris TaxID=412437 RepID=UPI001E2D2EFD|nr:YdbH domain-containing protein [Rheinheimera aquimaris]MCD1598449.1 YdbH domain-containing protein [Rheinheimera aquimaris]